MAAAPASGGEEGRAGVKGRAGRRRARRRRGRCARAGGHGAAASATCGKVVKEDFVLAFARAETSSAARRAEPPAYPPALEPAPAMAGSKDLNHIRRSLRNAPIAVLELDSKARSLQPELR